ncbi:hypothetical protein [Aestuariivirga sp.]|uniref:hypothetical protein n=1 Tax=Aestuariivirga sp. TaxID=2650926 RepID=UPI00359470B9
MPRQSRRFVILLGLGVLLAACGSDEEALQKYAKARKMPENQTAAFMACANEMKRNKPVFATPKGNLVMTSVPWDICACQSKTMITVFEDDRHKAIASFATYMALETKKRPPRFSKKDMKPKLKSPDVAKRLETAFNACVTAYKDANKEKSAELFELLPPKEPDKKKDGEAKSSS